MNKTRHSTLGAAWLAALVLLAPLSARAADDRSPSPEKERQLIEVLRSASPAEKAIACKQLATQGSKEAVPELAKLLADEQLASWARIALEAIPDPAAGEALTKSLDTLQGRLLIGAINSLGVRREAQADQKLIGRLQDQDAEVASAAAVALGRISNDAATSALRKSLSAAPAGASDGVLSAVAEGCILCAERLMSAGKDSEAAALYDEVRKANVPKQRKLEATRGAILARKTQGIPLLVEQLRSSDKSFFQIGLGTARELAGREVADAVAAELSSTAPDKAALLLFALADRKDAGVSPAVLDAARSGDKQVRIAAIGLIGRSGNASHVGVLLAQGVDEDAEVADAAKAALVALPGEDVNQKIASLLKEPPGTPLPVLIAVVGQRRIPATAVLSKAVEHADAATRRAALSALGETIGPNELAVLITQVVSPQHADDAQTAQRAFRAACIRMPDRDATAAELAAAMSRAPAATKARLLEILGSVGGPKALETVGSAVKSSDEALQDTGSRLLGEWMSADAAPLLLDLAKTAPSDKYQVRALRGYIRIARQFALPDSERAEMCSSALAASARPEEQKMVLAVLERYPSKDTLAVAVQATESPALKEDASRVALVIAQKLGGKAGDMQALLEKVGLGPVKLEILKAEYGAGATQKDVTEILKRLARGLPLIALPSSSYNESFGGDPAPNTVKQLKVEYRINGKPGAATFAENANILLPMPK